MVTIGSTFLSTSAKPPVNLSMDNRVVNEAYLSFMIYLHLCAFVIPDHLDIITS